MRFLLLPLAFFSLFSSLANAYDCKTATTSVNINLPMPLVIPPSLPIGGYIGQYQAGLTTVSTCSNTAGITSDRSYVTAHGTNFIKANDGSWVSIQPGLTGIGFALGAWTDDCSGPEGWVISGTWSASLCSSINSPIKNNITIKPMVRLYRISWLSANNVTLPSTSIGTLYRTVNDSMTFNTEVYLSATTISVPACEVSNSAINVKMGSVQQNKFNGIGTTAGQTQNFSINLNCTSVSKVSAYIEAVSVYDSQKGILKLTGSSAKGIGIQLLYKDQPLPLYTNLAVGTASVGQFTIPLKARYYQIDNITPGTANSTATFTMKYQ